MNTENKIHKARIEDIISKTNDVYEIVLQIEDSFSFKPGQYIWIELLNLDYPDKKGGRRAFSVIRDGKDGRLKFFLRYTASGYKKTLVNLKKDAEVKIIGPFGSSFCLPQGNESLLLLAGSVGITPFMSIINFAVENNLQNKIKLIFRTTDKERSLFVEYVRKMRDIYPIHEGIVVSDFTQDIDSFIKDEKDLVYISGSQKFVDEAYEFLLQKKFDKDKFKFENFYPITESVRQFHEMFETYMNSDKNDRRMGDILFSAIEGSSNHTVITDANGIILFANDAAQKITGFTFEEMKGNTPRLWGGQMSSEFYKELWMNKMHGTSTRFELINRRKDGTLYNVLSHITTIRNNNNEVIGFIGNEEDISEIRKREEELLERTREAELLNRVTVDRELKMIELKEENKKLKEKLYGNN